LGGLIPLSDASRRPVRLPVVTAFIIVVNVFVFLLELTRGDAFVTGNPRVVEEMSNVGVGRYLRLLGVMEIAFAAPVCRASHDETRVYSRVLLLRGCDRDRAVARRFEGQSLCPDRTALDRRFHSGSLDFLLI
jgi:hypothetical protein